MAETITVLSLKGGTGKTTTVRTLADVFRRIGLDVLCVDLDPQGNLSDYFDVPGDATPTVGDMLSGGAKAKAATHDGIIPASPILAEVERGLSGKIGRELVLRKALKDARKQHDVILIDCPPALGLLTINGLVAADWALISSEAQYFALQGVNGVVEALDPRAPAGPGPRLHRAGRRGAHADQAHGLAAQAHAAARSRLEIRDEP